MAGKLVDSTIRSARNKAIKSKTAAKLSDGGGLYLLTTATGQQYWRMKYRHGGVERLLSFGVYPEVSLKEARDRRGDARKVIRDGRDPAAEERARKAAKKLGKTDSFKTIADEWLLKQKPILAEITHAKAKWMLGLVSSLDAIPVADLAAPTVLAALRRIESAGTIDTAHRVKSLVGRVMRYAVATGRAQTDPTSALRGALAPIVTKSHAAVTDPAKIGELLRAIDGYTGQPATQAALKLAPMLFARPGNLRAMEWAELDLTAAEWRIPAGKMKTREAHVVPLPKQAVVILKELRALTSHSTYCFPSLRTRDKPMSENTVNAALRKIGYTNSEMVGHGFRAMASTRLNELGWAPDVIERQLAHAERNKVRAVYNRAQYLPERRKMMQAWADYLDGLRAGDKKVVPMKRRA
jgi:integrase